MHINMHTSNFLSPFLSLSQYSPLSLYIHLNMYITFCVATYILLSLQFCHCVSASISDSLTVYFPLSPSLSLVFTSPSHCIYMKISLYSYLSILIFPPPLRVSISLSLCFYPSLCLFTYLSFIISLSFHQRSIICVYISLLTNSFYLCVTVSLICYFPLMPTLPFIPLSRTS